MIGRHSSGWGFTLLEVMIALAILAGAMLAVSQLTSAALHNHTRAVRLEVATLLARGKLAALQDGYEQTGFGDFDEDDEGTFEADGHPEMRWKVEVKKPTVELGADRILAMLTGSGAEGGGSTDLSTVLGQTGSQGGGAGDSGTGAFPSAEALSGALQTQLNQIGEQIRKGVRQVRLTVSWQDGARTESFSVVTHLVVLQAKEST